LTLKIPAIFLQLAHTKLEVYSVTWQLVLEAYKITAKFPQHERFALSSQLQRSAVSVLLNITEGSARRLPKDRFRFYELRVPHW